MNSDIYVIPDRFPLSEEEKKQPQAYLYDVPMEDPEEEVFKALAKDNPLKPEQALAPEDVELFYTKNGYPIRNGYCLREDGSAFLILTTTYDGLTYEEYQQSGAGKFVTANPLNYKIWFPVRHFRPDYKDIIEDVGFGYVNIVRYEPAEEPTANLSKTPKELDERTENARLGATANVMYPLDGSEPYIHTMLQRYITDENGKLLKQRVVWAGIYWKDGKPIRSSTKPEDVERTRLLLCHMAYEDHRTYQLAKLFLKK